MIAARYRPRRRLRLLLLLLSTATCTFTLIAVSARPAAAHIPIKICSSLNEGDPYRQYLSDGTSDYVDWKCLKTTDPNFPVYHYWKIVGMGNTDDEMESSEESLGKFWGDQVWQGLVIGGFGVFPAGVHRAHIRVEGAFQLRYWSGSPLSRDMGVQLVLRRYVNGAWQTCKDTGWKNASATSQFSYTFWMLISDCNGTIRLSTRAHFFKESTQTWWTSDWVRTDPYTIIGV